MATTDKIPEGYTPPLTRAEALNRLDEAKSDITAIETQLGDPDKTSPDGERLGFGEYRDWRRRAKTALKWRIEELRLLKAWLRDNLPPVKARPSLVVAADTDDAIAAAFNALKSVAYITRRLDDRLAALAAVVREEADGLRRLAGILREDGHDDAAADLDDAADALADAVAAAVILDPTAGAKS